LKFIRLHFIDADAQRSCWRYAALCWRSLERAS